MGPTLFLIAREGEIIGKLHLGQILEKAAKGELLPTDHAYQTELAGAEWVFLPHLIFGFFRELPWDEYDKFLQKEKDKVDSWIKAAQEKLLSAQDKDELEILNSDLSKYLWLRKHLTGMPKQERTVRRENEKDERDELKKVRPRVEKLRDDIIEIVRLAGRTKTDSLNDFEKWESSWPDPTIFPYEGFELNFSMFKAFRRLKKISRAEAFSLAKQIVLRDSEDKKTEIDYVFRFLIERGVHA